MAIRKIVELPGELPHARLFLDDVEEISRLLRDAYAPLVAGKERQLTVCYAIRDSHMDSLEDLREHGGSTRHLEIALRNDRDSYFPDASVQFVPFLKPKIRLYAGLPDGDRWALYGRVKSIFESRQLRMTNAINALPGWLKVTAWLALVLLIPNVLSVIHGAPRLQLGLWAGYLLVFAVIGFLAYRSSTVVLMPSRERAKARSVAARGYVRDLIFLIVGAVIGAVAKHFLK